MCDALSITRELGRILHPRPPCRGLLYATDRILPFNTVKSTTRCKAYRLKYSIINRIEGGGKAHGGVT
jgi:hypothetical protein